MIRILGAMFITATTLLGGVGGDVRLSKPPDPNAPAERLFIAASRSFQDGHWATSAKWFRELITRHQNSGRRPRAVLMRLQALYMQGMAENQNSHFTAALNELVQNPLEETPLADEALFWKAECHAKLNTPEAAALAYQQLLRDHASSPRAMEAVVALANLSAAASDWAKVVEHLQPAEGVFQKSRAANPDAEAAFEGGLLLAQALFAQGNHTAARTVLGGVPAKQDPDRDWRRRLLRARIAAADDQMDEAELLGDQLRTMAEQHNSVDRLVAAYEFRAGLFAAKSQWAKARGEWGHLLKDSLPVAVRQRAALNVALTDIRAGDFAGAVTVFQKIQAEPKFAGIHAQSDCLLGELNLAMHRFGQGDKLQLAESYFKKQIQNETNRVLRAQALWGFSQCQLGRKDHASRESLQSALELAPGKLMRSQLQFQLATDFARANAHAEARAGFANVRTNSVEGISADLLNAARFMQFKSTLAAGDLPAAGALLAEMRAQAGASHLDKALLALAQSAIDRREPETARTLLVEFQQQAPGSNLSAAAELEAIRLLMQESKWPAANAAYVKWLAANPQHPARAKVLYDQAWAMARSGDEEQAAQRFAQLSTNAPATSPVFMARMWLADRAYNSRTNLLASEKLFKEIRGATNCPSALSHRAGMMAGRAAMRRQGYDEARAMFTGLIDDGQVQTNSPAIFVEASFALADLTLLELGSEVENQIAKLTDSTNQFDRLIKMYPTNAIAARAWGRIGDCCLMVSGDRPDYHAHAKAAYEKSLSITGPVPVSVRSQAHVGLAQTLERQAPAGAGREEGLKEAVDHLLAVYSGRHLKEGEKLDRYWRRQSGLMVLRLLTQLNRFDQALTICEELKKDFPGMRDGLEVRGKQIISLKEKQP